MRKVRQWLTHSPELEGLPATNTHNSGSNPNTISQLVRQHRQGHGKVFDDLYRHLAREEPGGWEAGALTCLESQRLGGRNKKRGVEGHLGLETFSQKKREKQQEKFKHQ